MSLPRNQDLSDDLSLDFYKKKIALKQQRVETLMQSRKLTHQHL